MPSPITLITAAASLLGIILNSTVLYLVLSNAKRLYHYLFAGILLTCLIWNLGIFLTMIRNTHPDELILYGYIATSPGMFIPALVFHFSCAYSGRTESWPIYLIWAFTLGFTLLSVLGFYGKLDGVYHYNWGNIFKLTQSTFMDMFIFIYWLVIMLLSCWILYQGRKSAGTELERRHYTYIIAGFLAMTFAVVKVVIIMGINIPLVLPLGMILNDVFVAVIGIAIVKDQLLDITVIVKKGALYSVLAAIVIFVFSFSEHIFANYVSELIGGHSQLLHLASIAIVIAVLMPVKHRLEHYLDKAFKEKKLEF